MPKDDPENHGPSDLALKNAREIGELSSVTKNLAADIGSLSRDMREGFAHQDRNIDRLAERINKPPDKSLYLGVAGLMVAGVIPIAALIYFTVTSTTAPLAERVSRNETVLEEMRQESRDDFELMIRDDQVLVDQNMKINDTDTAIKAEENAKKFRKKRLSRP